MCSSEGHSESAVKDGVGNGACVAINKFYFFFKVTATYLITMPTTTPPAALSNAGRKVLGVKPTNAADKLSSMLVNPPPEPLLFTLLRI